VPAAGSKHPKTRWPFRVTAGPPSHPHRSRQHRHCPSLRHCLGQDRSTQKHRGHSEETVGPALRTHTARVSTVTVRHSVTAWARIEAPKNTVAVERKQWGPADEAPRATTFVTFQSLLVPTIISYLNPR
jgi:hypothetical protein